MVVNIDEMSLGGSPMIQCSRAGTQTVNTWGENSGEHFLTVTHTCSRVHRWQSGVFVLVLVFLSLLHPFPQPLSYQTNQSREKMQTVPTVLLVHLGCLPGRTDMTVVGFIRERLHACSTSLVFLKKMSLNKQVKNKQRD